MIQQSQCVAVESIKANGGGRDFLDDNAVSMRMRVRVKDSGLSDSDADALIARLAYFGGFNLATATQLRMTPQPAVKVVHDFMGLGEPVFVARQLAEPHTSSSSGSLDSVGGGKLRKISEDQASPLPRVQRLWDLGSCIAGGMSSLREDRGSARDGNGGGSRCGSRGSLWREKRSSVTHLLRLQIGILGSY